MNEQHSESVITKQELIELIESFPDNMIVVGITREIPMPPKEQKVTDSWYTSRSIWKPIKETVTTIEVKWDE